MDMHGRYITNNNIIYYNNNYPYNTSFSSTSNSFNYQNSSANNYNTPSLKKVTRNSHQKLEIQILLSHLQVKKFLESWFQQTRCFR